jgi:hypothetical protein
VVKLQQQYLRTLALSFIGTVGLSGKALFDIYSEKSVSNCDRNVSYIEFFVVLVFFWLCSVPVGKKEKLFGISSRPLPYEFMRCAPRVFHCGARVGGMGGKRADLEVIYNLCLSLKIIL